MPTGSLRATPRAAHQKIRRGAPAQENTHPSARVNCYLSSPPNSKTHPWCGSCSLFFYFLSVAATEPETTDAGPGRVRRSTHTIMREVHFDRCLLRAGLHLSEFWQKNWPLSLSVEIQMTIAEVSTTIFSCSWNLLTRFMLVSDARTNGLDGGKVNRKLCPGCGTRGWPCHRGNKRSWLIGNGFRLQTNANLCELVGCMCWSGIRFSPIGGPDERIVFCARYGRERERESRMAGRDWGTEIRRRWKSRR